MDEKKDIAIQETTSKVREPIGVRVIGTTDPRTLDISQFSSSPELLFHGASSNFEFSNKYNYRDPAYFKNKDGSQTLGQGFYATGEKEAAENYSIVRQYQQQTPIVIEVLPYQARMLDLRAKFDPTKNGSVPQELFNKWFEKFRTHYLDVEARKKDSSLAQIMEMEYFDYLIKLRDSQNQPDLRVMLGTGDTGDANLRSPNFPAPSWMKLFSEFMVEQGYDGLVYNEGGEGRNAKSHTSFIFYNLEKVGTFESWKQQ